MSIGAMTIKHSHEPAVFKASEVFLDNIRVLITFFEVWYESLSLPYCIFLDNAIKGFAFIFYWILNDSLNLISSTFSLIIFC